LSGTLAWPKAVFAESAANRTMKSKLVPAIHERGAESWVKELGEPGVWVMRAWLLSLGRR
jgi:hypothetical protein